MPIHFTDHIVASHGFEMLAAIIGSLLWVWAYILMIRKGIQDRTYGLPLVAIALNFTWEVIYVFVYPPDIPTVLWLRVAWLVTDAANVWLLIWYGRAVQSVPEIRQHFYFVLLGTFVLAYVGHIVLHHRLQDAGGDESAYSINFIMSILFVFLYFGRRDMRGLSYGGAWAKMLGTGIMSLAAFLSFLRSGGTHYLLEFLFVAIFIFDVLYVRLLHIARGGGTPMAEPAPL